MNENVNALNWFEIPAGNLERAKKFYEAIFLVEMPVMEMMGMNMAMFPATPGNGKVSGALIAGDGYVPSDKGVTLYLNANPDLQMVLNRIEKAGGKVLMPKTEIGPDIGFMAFFTDSEGNRMGLHSGM